MASIDYNSYMSRALQKMIGDLLSEVAENGLPGAHHFYIQFRTKAKGVVLPDHLKTRFPEEMTIVMQEWFDNLGVMDDRFAVTLSFGGKAENLVIPFEAITGFSDPSANFSLQFEEVEVDFDEDDTSLNAREGLDDEPTDASEHENEAQVISFSDFKKK